MMKNKEHLNIETLKNIIYLAYKMNLLGKRKYKLEELFSYLKINTDTFLFNEINKKLKNFEFLSVKNSKKQNINLEFLGGLIQGDGCFNISF
jgi:hypothetical protein